MQPVLPDMLITNHADAPTVLMQATSPEIIARWKEEVLAMPAKKMKNWKGALKDQQGAWQKVRYVGELRYVGGDTDYPYEFEAWQPSNRPIPSVWLPVVSCFAGRRPTTTVEPLSRAGARMQGLQGEDLAREYEEIQRENFTGNHHRNPKPVKVPTKAGEPVRA